MRSTEPIATTVTTEVMVFFVLLLGGCLFGASDGSASGADILYNKVVSPTPYTPWTESSKVCDFRLRPSNVDYGTSARPKVA